MKKNNALIVIDVQNDFCPGGALAVERGDEIVPLINSIMDRFYRVVATQDWHPRDQVSFASNHQGKNVFDVITINGIEQTLWPDHCVAGTQGACLHPDMREEPIDLIIRKGTNPGIDSYSAFMENDKKTATGLEGFLRFLDIKELFLCGLATDFCVFYSAMDAARAGFDTTVLIDACRGIDMPENNVNMALDSMRNAGVKIINTDEL